MIYRPSAEGMERKRSADDCRDRMLLTPFLFGFAPPGSRGHELLKQHLGSYLATSDAAKKQRYDDLIYDLQNDQRDRALAIQLANHLMSRANYLKAADRPLLTLSVPLMGSRPCSRYVADHWMDEVQRGLRLDEIPVRSQRQT